MKRARVFRFSRGTAMLVSIMIVFSVARAARAANEFQILLKEAEDHVKTSEGRKYEALFTKATAKAVVGAMGACKVAPKSVERADIVFIVSADGRVIRVLSTPGVAYGECIVSKLRLPERVPRPPRDSWPAVILIAYNETRPGPPDTPRRMKGEQQTAAYDKAIAPYIAKARATYPAAKKRFLGGLPPGHKFSVWIRLKQGDLRFEDVFVDVDSIANGMVHGRISNRVELLTNHKQGERISFSESEVRNWLILRPDGVEEGNPVGKFLDHYKPR